YMTPPCWSFRDTAVEVFAKVIRSGARNMLDAHIQQTSFMGNRSFPDFNSLFSLNTGDKILNTSVQMYDNTTNLRTWGHRGGEPNRYNSYVDGSKGNVKVFCNYIYNHNREYVYHNRSDGYLTDYSPF